MKSYVRRVASHSPFNGSSVKLLYAACNVFSELLKQEKIFIDYERERLCCRRLVEATRIIHRPCAIVPERNLVKLIFWLMRPAYTVVFAVPPLPECFAFIFFGDGGAEVLRPRP